MPSKESLAQKIVALVEGFADGAGATGWQTMLRHRNDAPETYKDEVESVEEVLDEAIREAVLNALTDYRKICVIEEFNCVDSEFGERELDRRIAEAEVRLAQLREGKT